MIGRGHQRISTVWAVVFALFSLLFVGSAFDDFDITPEEFETAAAAHAAIVKDYPDILEDTDLLLDMFGASDEGINSDDDENDGDSSSSLADNGNDSDDDDDDDSGDNDKDNEGNGDGGSEEDSGGNEDESGWAYADYEDDGPVEDSDTDGATDAEAQVAIAVTSAPWVSKRPIGCRNSWRNPQVCYHRGKQYRYRYRTAVKRGNRWYKNSKSNLSWHRGRWVTKAPVRHPYDPRYKRVAGKWTKRSAKIISKFVKAGHLWWRDSRKRQFWYGGKWRTPQWQVKRNDPRYFKLRGRWFRRRKALGGVTLWQGIWRRGSKGYWNGKWIPIGKIIGNDPNFRRVSRHKWVNRSVSKPTRYDLRWGRWFKNSKSNLVFRNRKWVNYKGIYRNDPRYRRSRRGVWHKIKGSGKAYQRHDGAWYMPGGTGNGLVFRNRKWISSDSYKNIIRGKAAQAAIAKGDLPESMRAAVKAQVYVNFSRFIKWFVSNYLRAGNNLAAKKRITTDDVHDNADGFNPQPYAKKSEPEAQGVSDRGAPPTSAWLIDAKTRKGDSATEHAQSYKATIHAAETAAVDGAKGVFGIRSDDVSNGRAIKSANFLQVAEEEKR